MASSSKGKKTSSESPLQWWLDADRLEKFVDLQKKALERWSKYSIETAQRAAAGKFDPQEWIDDYAKLTQQAFKDLGEFYRLMVPRERA